MQKNMNDQRAIFYETSSIVLAAMANANRISILALLLRSGEISVGALSEELSLGQAAMSQHLAKLRRAGLVRTRREAQTIYYSILSAVVEQILASLPGIFLPLPRQLGQA